MKRTPHLLAIQSHVVFGHAGNSAAVFPMQRVGVIVWPLNTVQFSNHTQYGQWAGEVLAPEQIPALVDGIAAIGSGGMTGKGWTHGTQAHLEFVPERTTDFIFAVYSEEFGLVGNLILMLMYLLLVGRGMMIAANAPSFFTRLLAGAITMIFFTYAFVNMGMVSGILPVVGVPLPFLSYGGTALLTLGVASGILMSIQRHRKLVQT